MKKRIIQAKLAEWRKRKRTEKIKKREKQKKEKRMSKNGRERENMKERINQILLVLPFTELKPFAHISFNSNNKDRNQKQIIQLNFLMLLLKLVEHGSRHE